jgi:hypothetical protein
MRVRLERRDEIGGHSSRETSGAAMLGIARKARAAKIGIDDIGVREAQVAYPRYFLRKSVERVESMVVESCEGAKERRKSAQQNEKSEVGLEMQKKARGEEWRLLGSYLVL